MTPASAAGVLMQIGDAAYTVSKAAAVAFAEWLSVTYGDRGIQVHCLAPMGVNTNLLNAGLEADSQSVNVVAAAGERNAGISFIAGFTVALLILLRCRPI